MINIIPTNSFTLQQAPKFANLFWLSALSVDIRINLESIKNIEDEVRPNVKNENKSYHRRQTIEKRNNAIRKIIWDVMDSYIVSTYLQYMKPYSSIVGIFGMFTSTLALHDIWKKC